jgi:hypothetical protein
MTQSKQLYRVVESKPIHNLSRNDKSRRAILRQVNGLAWLLDNSIRIPLINYRIGFDALLGLIPGFGDFAGALMSGFIVFQAIRLDMSRAVLTRMALNVAIEATVGMIPLVGDIFDATFKANARNVELLNQVMGTTQASRAMGRAAGRGAIALVLGALASLIVLLGAVGATLFWWVVSLFR